MSLILEALRKSEAERRRGQTPDLLSDATPVVPAAHATTRNAGAVISIAAAALITLLLVVWWLRPATTHELEPDVPAAGSSGPDAAAMATPVPAPEPLQARVGSQVRATVASAPAGMQPAPAEIPPPAMRPSPPGATDAAIARTNTPPPSSQPSPAIATPSQAAISTTRPAQALPIEPPVAPAQPVFTSPDVPLRLADLPSDERQQLPALKVSMHMWASDPANRFAIIDGARVNEGDRVGDAIVQAIQQDGVLLAWRGRSIRLPIR